MLLQSQYNVASASWLDLSVIIPDFVKDDFLTNPDQENTPSK